MCGTVEVATAIKLGSTGLEAIAAGENATQAFDLFMHSQFKPCGHACIKSQKRGIFLNRINSLVRGGWTYSGARFCLPETVIIGGLGDEEDSLPSLIS
jgi:hypothetical protein